MKAVTPIYTGIHEHEVMLYIVAFTILCPGYGSEPEIIILLLFNEIDVFF
jgi:hypothetical protein